MKPHGNSHKNKEEHHLYMIFDIELQQVYKYGICGESLLPDGSSPRANRQVREFNRVVGLQRFTATVIETNIPGRKQAEEVEIAHIKAHERKYGRPPRGN